MPLNCQNAFVAIATSDLNRLISFYTQLLGYPPQTLIPQVYAEFQLPGLRLGIFKPKTDDQGEFQPASRGQMSLCLEVQDLETVIAHLDHIGYPPHREITVASHGREIYLHDPTGNRIILHESH